MTELHGLVVGPRPRRPARPATWPWVLGCVLTGVAAGAAWRLLVPVLVDARDEERGVAGDGAFALACLVAGLLVGAALARAGAADWRRYLTSVLCSVGGAGLAWGTGRLLGAPPLGAVGVPLLWPVVTSATAFVSILVAGFTGSAERAPRSLGPPLPGSEPQEPEPPGSASPGDPGRAAIGQQ